MQNNQRRSSSSTSRTNKANKANSSNKGNKPYSKPNNLSGNKPSFKSNSKPHAKSAPKPHASHAQPKAYPVTEPTELLLFLLSSLSNLGRNAVKSILARGQVSVNGRAVTAYNFPLQPGHTVTIQREKIVEQEPLIGLSIVHEDEDIIVIHKEAGLLSIASDQENEITAYRQLTSHVRQHNPNSRIFVVHRLDRDTSGVMLFAKNEQAKQTLQNSWQDMVQERSYVALVEGKVKKESGTIKSWLKESSTLKMYSSPYDNDGQLAVTHYKVIQTIAQFSLLEVHLETGRKNQIRVHMQDIGHPIVGDKKYGSKSKAIGRLGLHARVIAFTHPTTGQLIRYETDIPKTFLKPFRTETAPQ
ncbi:RluA family pseudouridine synthase [Paenibacillus sp. 481]|uniref:RluA family pseudouridine synthase n=1 Tax=Paenibacillus sp. 481 TaxID=2835869 RepID=UPI001E2F310A|nr:RluA family pseudouridine synthase [Paenibacillus sp. 481]UHA72231.1 RluA family pseudouridine synthase [Paenibacillus sp. 481]